MKAKILVLDTAAFVKNVSVWELCEELYCPSEVIQELKHSHTRDFFIRCPIEIKRRQPLPENVKFIIEYAKKTGDYCALSATDIKVIALTYELELDIKGSSSHLNLEPAKPVTKFILPSKKITEFTCSNIEGFYVPENKNVTYKDDTGSQLENNELSPNDKLLIIEKRSDKKMPFEGSKRDSCLNNKNNEERTSDSEIYHNFEDALKKSLDLCEYSSGEDYHSCEEYISDNEAETCSDDEGWLSPSNISNYKSLSTETAVNSDVACCTSDFSVQNVLKHLGITIFGCDGKIIDHKRSYVLRCYACFHITSNMTKVFCPKCGNKTLKRVSVTLNSDGITQLWISRKKPLSAKGTKFSLPAPKGGKHAINPILVEDQRVPHNLSSRLSRKKYSEDDYATLDSPFGVRDVYSRAAQMGCIGHKKHQGLFYWEKKNPNVPMKRRGNKKKK